MTRTTIDPRDIAVAEIKELFGSTMPAPARAAALDAILDRAEHAGVQPNSDLTGLHPAVALATLVAARRLGYLPEAW